MPKSRLMEDDDEGMERRCGPAPKGKVKWTLARSTLDDPWRIEMCQTRPIELSRDLPFNKDTNYYSFFLGLYLSFLHVSCHISEPSRVV